MTSVHLEQAKILHQAIRSALIEEWDPIGIVEIPEAKDEYDSYVPTIYKTLIARKPRHEIFDYLWLLEAEHMGLTGDRQRTERFAGRLLRLGDKYR